ncbi:hypothetical protein DdX_08700 [Ditylenchus destructor]|uniref:Uncharacterized protein n=1 Tax=Ditylenchus destructor TaxID=166010 RepID=A0AAD4N1K5_9BILA|nr:hypothetical protein DdX_08700 [Ditylenchus destructor]
MATLLCTRIAAVRLIMGTSQPQVAPQMVESAVVTDATENFLTSGTMQNHVRVSSNAISGPSGLKYVKHITSIPAQNDLY